MSSADKHLSELCQGSDIDAIITRLRQVAPVEDAQTGDDTSANGAPSGGLRDRCGVWGYRDNDGRTAFHWAVSLKNFDLARSLMNPPYCSPVLTEDEEWTTPFATACSVGAPLEFLQEVLDKSVAELAEYTSWKAKFLSGAKAKPAESNGVASAAVEGGASTNPSEAVAMPEVPGIAIAQDAASDKAVATILDAADATGLTPLLFAAGRGHLNIVQFLVEHGAVLNQQNHRGQSVLHRAVNRGNMELVEYIVSTSAKKNGSNKAAQRRFLDLQDARGDSALFYASMDNNEEMGRYLLRRGADRELRNKDGKCFWEV